MNMFELVLIVVCKQVQFFYGMIRFTVKYIAAFIAAQTYSVYIYFFRYEPQSKLLREGFVVIAKKIKEKKHR